MTKEIDIKELHFLTSKFRMDIPIEINPNQTVGDLVDHLKEVRVRSGESPSAYETLSTVKYEECPFCGNKDDFDLIAGVELVCKCGAFIDLTEKE